jgi:TolA-binding protein
MTFTKRISFALLLLLMGGLSHFTQAQVQPDQAAEMLLTAGRKAYNEGNLPFAAKQFREFIQKFGGHAKANDARYGLALSLLDGPERNFEQAIEPLNYLVGQNQFPEHPQSLYYLGLAHRGLGVLDLANTVGKNPPETQQLKQKAEGRFGEAIGRFDAGAKLFAAKIGKVEANPKVMPPEVEWLARCKVEQAEIEIRLNRLKEARTTTEGFEKDPLLSKTPQKLRGLYYHGFAAYLQQDYLVAGRALNQLAPFADPDFGLHARYLMGRIHQLTGEQAEARTMYEGVLTQYDQQKKEGTELLKDGNRFKDRPWEKQRLESLVKTVPEFVVASRFHAATLLYEAGRFGEALPMFQSFLKENTESPFASEAVLRLGFCLVQLKQFPEAVGALQPLVEKAPKLADQSLFWIGKAQIGQALASDPTKPQEREEGLKKAQTTLRTASDRANQLALQNDPDARIRRAEILLELADAMQLLKQSKEAATVYEQLINEKLLPARTEELYQRWISALHLSGEYQQVDQLISKFQQDFPTSPLQAAVSFRSAENAYFVALAADKKADLPNRATELPKLWDEAAKRYRVVIEKYPEFERASLARFGLAMCQFRKGDFEQAQAALESIPAPDRIGDLGIAPYLLAECLIRLAPASAEDALAAGMLQDRLSQAASQLEAFISGSPKAAEVPDAMLKLGYCQVRLALLLAQPNDRNATLQIARQTYEKLIQQFPNAPQSAVAQMERAKCQAQMGDRGGALNELRKFTQDPLQNSSVAPTAVLQLAILLREQNKADEAANLINAARQKHEPQLQKEPERIALLCYHHGVCLYEAGKFAEAKQALEGVFQVSPNSPVSAEAALRSGQSRINEAKKTIETARQNLTKGDLKDDQRQNFNNQIQTSYQAISETAQQYEQRADGWKATLPTTEARARIYYEAAWAWRSVSENEVNQARLKLAQEKQKQLQDEVNKKTPPNQKPPTVPLPEIPISTIPAQPGEAKARSAYLKLIENFPELYLAVEGRFELSEMLSERGDHAAAIKLLREALDKEPTDKPPTPELMDRIRIRLGTALAANKELEAAMSQFDVIANNPKSLLIAQAQYRAGEILLANNEPEKAIERLKLFRDKPEFQNVPNVTERALFRLGHALGLLKQWEPSRVAYEQVVNRFGHVAWVHDARYGIGWAYQNLGQFDQAVNFYNQVIANTNTELGAKSHLQIGLCRIEQKKWSEAVSSLLVVPFTFDYPDLSAVALVEASRALVEDKKPEQAERLLQKVLKEYPKSPWAKVAEERLSQLKK